MLLDSQMVPAGRKWEVLLIREHVMIKPLEESTKG